MSDNLSIATMETTLSVPVERGAFSLFPKLPIELRRMIWWSSCALNLPRLINISKVWLLNNWSRLVARYVIPSQLRINQESRQCAQRYYDYAFGPQMNGRQIHFNFDIDALVFDKYPTLLQFIGTCHVEGRYFLPALLPVHKKVLAIAVCQRSFCGLPCRGQDLEALGNPDYLQMITSKVAPANSKAMEEQKWRDRWERQYSNGLNGYFGPTVKCSTIKQFQTKLNILHNPKLGPKPKPKPVVAPKRRSARLQGRASST
ncbi:hypothetical protein ONS95_007162 [Cadophora gregata]|uniref:uncharacterized protein n=1 Tax=Cadophora gregata TaxID=51156 RepID=UPI0026DB0D13|nr:uncharacterized protein ONS95_007162 [Cadophora gregata]KAK0100711.1 hypothetical protein ONS95_007162 [Cadophora gregata]KAK0117292.1 hypothetical protein ONS96_013125 [Cadophora gregata f. sp. sojae]